MPGSQAKNQLADIWNRMDQSPYKFRGGTKLEPGFGLDLFIHPGGGEKQARRTYVFTDGELHDPTECEETLVAFPANRIEVHGYGFGGDFNAGVLKHLIGPQLGGRIRVIKNAIDLSYVFRRVAEINSGLLASGAVFRAEFATNVIVGDAWAFKPQENYIGHIPNGRPVRELGALENGRSYSFLFEFRLPRTANKPPKLAEVGWFGRRLTVRSSARLRSRLHDLMFFQFPSLPKPTA